MVMVRVRGRVRDKDRIGVRVESTIASGPKYDLG